MSLIVLSALANCCRKNGIESWRGPLNETARLKLSGGVLGNNWWNLR
ncbi:unnamed protein product [Dibothriocephalus latus]|uniref:Uncharacterized protein n=1 Tax=Dibothriocephalus latus TaxID=60516 RepID=A0A3P6PS57_DIBLA|nr:unnamed protein product [Dibothriocephalus latus]